MSGGRAMPGADPDGGVGWYGKIPAAGDFMRRRLSHGLVAWWDKWLQYGLAALRQMPAGGAERAYAAAPLWNFAIPAGAGAGAVLLGGMAPSRDRVGRAYPLSAMAVVPAQAYQPGLLEDAGDYYRQLGATLLAAVRRVGAAEQLDRQLQAMPLPMAMPPARPAPAGQDILDILNAGQAGNAPLAGARGLAAWPELPFCFNPGSHTSYWWTNQADGAALQTYVHGGALNATLFLRLFAAPPAWRV
ncbi:type VI secretion system-associated protein TagF [Bordetella bronchiseptica]|uniref:type VI secretion system-associated protein TagF n=1 Tax=Bordetella bronchiseptica TaxID=518 RepID=UPI00028BAD94|nr:type VI secretion system-associated protein TagF [Bordetella bronchiseptica]CCJ57542.1 conserved hypothetical protein [Bordetella bronchiseptica MO149]